MMTEQEAATRWCPFARVARVETTNQGASASVVVGGVNRDALGKSSNPIASCRCIASACMAWRWLYDAKPKLDAKGRRTGRETVTRSESGYCGIAGKPVLVIEQ